ncbi:hypothetical protein KY339_02490 [Candidatus Woesearchaeota archaeon]|nr:hypothetical protein [Candidatus Woesearchaeota archaeon]
MELKQVLTQRLILQSPYQSALELYERSKKIDAIVKLGPKIILVPAAFVKAEELEGILAGERYAGTMSGMFFITEETPREYRCFAAFHELAEHAAPKGFDVTGLAGHYQALAVELGYAKHILGPEQYDKFFEWRKSIERTNFFKLKENGLIDKLKGRIEEIFQSIPEYLTYRKKQLVQIIEE